MDIDPEKRTGLLEQAALGGTETIGGLELRPMTAATWSLHQRLKRAAGDPDGEDWTLNLFSFIWLHAQPVAKLRASYSKPEQMLPEIFDFMATKQAAEALLWKEWMERQMEQFAASMTDSGTSPGGIAGPKT
jgi:hypothetical protein